MISTKRVLLNAFFSIRDNLDPDSNVTEESDPLSEKQFSPKNSTDAGTMISITSVRLNAHFSEVGNAEGEGISMNKSLTVHYFKSSADHGLAEGQIAHGLNIKETLNILN
jgi:hypothetical protein